MSDGILTTAWIAVPHHTIGQGSIAKIIVCKDEEEASKVLYSQNFQSTVVDVHGPNYYWPIVKTENGIWLLMGIVDHGKFAMINLYDRIRILAYGPSEKSVTTAALKSIAKEPILRPKKNYVTGMPPTSPFWCYRTHYDDASSYLNGKGESDEA